MDSAAVTAAGSVTAVVDGGLKMITKYQNRCSWRGFITNYL